MGSSGSVCDSLVRSWMAWKIGPGSAARQERTSIKAMDEIQSMVVRASHAHLSLWRISSICLREVRYDLAMFQPYVVRDGLHHRCGFYERLKPLWLGPDKPQA